MKNKKYIAAGLLTMAAMVTTGCSDSFLDVENPTQQPADEYFTTDAHLQEAVVAAYQPLHWPDWSHGEYCPLNIISDVMADDIWVGGSDANDMKTWHMMMNYEADALNTIGGIWQVCYKGIKRSNDVLEDMAKGISDMTEESAKYYEAQVKALRALYYTWLWKCYGNVIYFDHNFEGAPYRGTQYTPDEIYEFIIKDLDEVIALDVLPMKEDDANLERMTKAFVYMLYTEVVMYQNDETRMDKAAGYLAEIMNSGLYDLNPDYGNIFDVTGEWSKESIFEINYKSDNAVRSYGNPYYPGGTVLPRLISPNNWPDGTDGHMQGWGFAPVRQETYDRYEDGDTRREATCWVVPEGVEYNKRYQDTGIFLEKYVAKAGGNDNQKADADLNWNNNYRVYRYSETLLYAAELALRGHGSANAQDCLDRVRERAGASSIAATLDNVIEERHLEFVGEGKRYYDLIRTGKAASVLVPDAEGYRTNTWTESKKYLPIPQSEIDKAEGAIVQNNY